MERYPIEEAEEEEIESQEQELSPLQEAPQEITEETLRAEVNLLVFPFFALNNREVRHKRETEFKTVTERKGEKLEILWNVSANTKYGYPGPFDKEVHRAIEQIIDEIELPIRNPITFSTHEICKKIGKIKSGWQFGRIKQSLKRIAATTITTKGTFYSKSKQRWEEGVFHLYDIFFKGATLPDGRIAETNYLFLNELYLDSINARYVKPLDYKYYKKLKNAIAQRLYEILGVKFYGIIRQNRRFIRYRYATLCLLIPLRQQLFLSQAQRQLDQAHNKLIRTGFLAEAAWEGWFIRYTPGQRALDEVAKYQIDAEVVPELEEALTKEQQMLVIRVMETLKIPQQAAERLVRDHTPQEIEKHIRSICTEESSIPSN